MKTCPYCAEQIQDAAIKCRYCGEMIGATPDIGNEGDNPGVCPKCRHDDQSRKITSIISEQTSRTLTAIPHTIPQQWGDRIYFYQTIYRQQLETVTDLVRRLKPCSLIELEAPVRRTGLAAQWLGSRIENQPLEHQFYSSETVFSPQPSEDKFLQLVEEYLSGTGDICALRRIYYDMYYCSRDDVVFHPGKDKAVPPDLVDSLLAECLSEIKGYVDVETCLVMSEYLSKPVSPLSRFWGWAQGPHGAFCVGTGSRTYSSFKKRNDEQNVALATFCSQLVNDGWDPMSVGPAWFSLVLIRFRKRSRWVGEEGTATINAFNLPILGGTDDK